MMYRTWTANSARSPASIKITQAPDPFLVSPRNTWLPSSIRVRISTKIIPLAVPHYYIPQAEIFNDSRSVRNTFVPSRFYPSTPFLPFLATRDRGYPPAFLRDRPCASQRRKPGANFNSRRAFSILRCNV